MLTHVNCAIDFCTPLQMLLQKKTEKNVQSNKTVSWGDEFMKESGFMGDDEEEPSDDSNNEIVEFFSVHHLERDDSHRHDSHFLFKYI